MTAGAGAGSEQPPDGPGPDLLRPSPADGVEVGGSAGAVGGTHHAHGGVGFWLTAAAGWAVIAYGLRGMIQHRLDTRPANLAKFAIGGALIHDLVFAPLLLLVGVAISRATPGRVRGIVQAALIVSGSLVLFSYPLVRGYAHVLHNPSSLPHNYTANLAIVLGGVWVIAAVALVVRLRRG